MFAYLDAGTLTMLSAAFAGGIAGVLMLVRMYGHKFLGIFSKKHRRKAEVAEGELLGVQIDPETGQPIDAESSPTVVSSSEDTSSSR